MRRAPLIVLLLALAGVRPAAGQHCPPDSTLRDTIMATLSLGPGPEAAQKDVEQNDYLLFAQGVSEHFVAPARLEFTGWPGTFCRRPSNQPGIDTDCFGLSGTLQFNVDSLGRVTSSPATANTASVALNRALSQAVAAASTAGDLPIPTKRMWSSKTPLTLTIRSSNTIRPKTVPFLRTMMLGYSIEVPPIMTRAGQPVYPDIALRMRVEDRVLLEYVVDTTGAAEPATIRVVDAHYTEFVNAAVQAIRQTRFAPAQAQGCAVRTLVNQAVSFRMH